MKKLKTRLNRTFQVFCALTWGKYSHSVWDSKAEYSIYVWRGKTYYIPPYNYHKEE